MRWPEGQPRGRSHWDPNLPEEDGHSVLEPSSWCVRPHLRPSLQTLSRLHILTHLEPLPRQEGRPRPHPPPPPPPERRRGTPPPHPRGAHPRKAGPAPSPPHRRPLQLSGKHPRLPKLAHSPVVSSRRPWLNNPSLVSPPAVSPRPGRAWLLDRVHAKLCKGQTLGCVERTDRSPETPETHVLLLLQMCSETRG